MVFRRGYCVGAGNFVSHRREGDNRARRVQRASPLALVRADIDNFSPPTLMPVHFEEFAGAKVVAEREITGQSNGSLQKRS